MNKRLIWIGLGLVAVALVGLGILTFVNTSSSQRQHQATIYVGSQPVSAPFTTRATTINELMDDAGFDMPDGAGLTINSLPVTPESQLPDQAFIILQVHPTYTITLATETGPRTIVSAAATLGQALVEAGINLKAADALTPPANTLLNADMQATLLIAKPIAITTGSETLSAWSTGATVGEALASAGMSLQGLDYSKPGPDEPIPSNGSIEIIRVREQVALEKTDLPYSVDQIYDDSLNLGESKVIQSGVPGVKVSQVRIRYENGLEVSRTVEGEWVAREPTNQKLAVGTNMQLQTTTVDGINLQYWHSMTVYATSYAPCSIGVPGQCGYTTASGAAAGYGGIGVMRSWFNVLNGTRVYIPGYGYGTINDIGAGIPGKDWIDLGFDDSNYVEWYHNVTIYFLPPAPESVPWVLQ